MEKEISIGTHCGGQREIFPSGHGGSFVTMCPKIFSRPPHKNAGRLKRESPSPTGFLPDRSCVIINLL